MQLKINNFVKELKRALTDVNTGSYVEYNYGEDYFDDVLNLDEIVDTSICYCTRFNNGGLTYIELLCKLSTIQTEWNTSPIKSFYSFKNDVELLGDTIFEFNDFLKEHLDI